jgi:hypothetical protein
MKKRMVWSALALMVTIGGLGISFAQQSTSPSSPTLPETPVVGKEISGVFYPAVAGWPLTYGAADHSGSCYQEFTNQLLVEYQAASDDAAKNKPSSATH